MNLAEDRVSGGIFN